jgi:hypothetical protein
MDRFIPNRSASNLDVANYNVSREAKDVENMDAMSPTKVGAAASCWRLPAACTAHARHCANGAALHAGQGSPRA